MRAKAHRPFYVKARKILAPVPDVEPLKRGDLSLQRLFGKLARRLRSSKNCRLTRSFFRSDAWS
jgi:hypothetical protein